MVLTCLGYPRGYWKTKQDGYRRQKNTETTVERIKEDIRLIEAVNKKKNVIGQGEIFL